MTHTQYLFSFGHTLYPWNDCYSLAMVYTHVMRFLVTPYIHVMLVFHWLWVIHSQCFFWSRLISMQYLFFIGRGLHKHNACSPLVTAYTHAFLVSGNHFVDFVYGRIYLSITSTGFITGQGDIRGACDKFPVFFRMGTFIDSTHMKL